MKIKDGFVLREVANQAMVIAVGEASHSFRGMIKMNNTAKDIWMYIKDGLEVNDIIVEMMKKYNADKEVIEKDVYYIIDVLKEYHVLEDE